MGVFGGRILGLTGFALRGFRQLPGDFWSFLVLAKGRGSH